MLYIAPPSALSVVDLQFWNVQWLQVIVPVFDIAPPSPEEQFWKMQWLQVIVPVFVIALP